jgi:hypothetical protein
MLIELSEQEVTTLDLLMRRLHVRGLETNPTKIQGPSTSVKFLEVQWYEAFLFTDKVIESASSNIQSRNTVPRVPPWILEKTHFSFGCVTLVYLLHALQSC